jgi:signal transduction histidine kinase
MSKPVLYLRLIFIVAVATLIVLTWQSFRLIQDMVAQSDRVEHSYRVILQTEQILSLVKDAETGQRGYLLTHRAEFLEPYRSAASRIDRVIAALDSLAQGNPRQQVGVDSLRGIVEERLAKLNFGIINDTLSRRAVMLDRTALLIEGKTAMDRMRQLTASILEQEQKYLAEYQRGRSFTEQMTPKYVLVGSAVALVLLALSFLLVNRELRRRLLVQQELEQKVAALNRSNSELEQFAYVASHDLQEPLRKIRAFGDRLMLKHSSDLTEDGRGLLLKIENSAARMQGLIDDLLNFSRLVNRKGDLVETDLNRVMREVLTDLSETIRQKNADVRVIGTLPTMEAYPTQMRQLFQNLLSNALKFSKENERPQVRITAQQVKGSVIREEIPNGRLVDYHQLTVRDNGIGFDPQYAEKIFVIFQRLHSKGEFGGTGIGLAVCQRVVANHQGYIVARGKPGEGAEFHVYLPVVQQAEET